MNACTTWLLDGWLGSPWRLQWMQRRLGRSASSCRIWHYDTSGGKSLETVAAELSLHLTNSPSPVHLVGFSMGGIVIREALRQNPRLPVAKIICLNSPHQGTAPARCLTRPALRELRPGSPFLQRLNASPCTVPFLNVWCPGDLVVIPGWNARHPDASEEICSWMPAHAWPLLSPGLQRKMSAFLNGNTAEKTSSDGKDLQFA